jgi:hypothetical protein
MDRVSEVVQRISAGTLIFFSMFSTAFAITPPLSPNVTLGWNASSDPTVAGYYVYWGTSHAIYPNKVDVGTNTMSTLVGIVAGSTYYFSVTSYNGARVESSFVPEISYVTPGMLTLTQGSASGATNGVTNGAAGNTARIRFPVAPGQAYEVQASFNLKSWTNVWLTSIQTSNGWVEYDETLTRSVPAKFYRLAIFNQTVPSPTLGFQHKGSNLVLTWNGPFALQTATNAAGPYSDVLAASSPCTNLMSGNPKRFFRLRYAAAN